jgi:DivIVA domain-containing protein
MEVSSRQIQDRRFATAIRGYDRAEVDRFRAECAAHTSALEERTKIAEVHAASIEKELAILRSESDVLLQEARDARHKIIEEAKAEASLITSQASAAGGSSELSDAASKAAAIIAEAEASATLRIEGIEQIRGVAEKKAAGIIKRAEESAAMTQAEVDRQLHKARLDSNSIRASMEAQLAEIRQVIEDDSSSYEVDGDDGSELLIDLRGDIKEAESHSATG